MNGFSARLTARSNQPVITTLQFDVVRYSASVEGGPVAAEIAVTDVTDAEQALALLGCKVTLYAPDLTPVWWGLVEEVTAFEGGLEYGVSLRDMANRLCVLYSIATEGGSTAAQTSWAEDARSVSLYGRKELRYTLGTATADEAQTALTNLLAQKAMPQIVTRPGQGTDGAATLHCVGLWQTLDWRYLAQDSGRIVHAGEDESEALLGWGITDSQLVGFNSRDRRIHQLGAQLSALSEGDVIAVTGSNDNDGDYTVIEAAAVDEQVTYAAAAIFFDPSDDMHDGAELLDQLRAGEMIYVEDSTSNDGFWFLKSVAPDHATLHPATVAAESANDVTITQGNSVAISEALTLEMPDPGSKAVTILAHGVKIAQSFVVPSTDAAWTPGEIVVSGRRFGNPSDALKVELCADSSGAPGTVLDFGVRPASLLPAKALAAVSFSLNRTATLNPGATYWLVVSRTGANHHADCYKVGLDAEGGISGGALRLWTGAAWAERDGGLNFQVWGHAATTAQLADIAAAVSADGYITAASVRAASGVHTRRYRGGEQTALAEAQKLLRTGTAAGERLTATVSRDGVLVVETAPATAPDTLRWQGGRVVSPFGQDLPQGVLPVGRWVQVRAPRLAGMLSSDLQLIARAEYDVTAAKLTPAWGAEGDWQMIEQG